MEITVSLPGILVSTIVGMALGALWYSPALFGVRWMQSIGKTPENLGSSVGPMTGSVIACLLTAVGVAILFSFIGVDDLATALAIGLILGLLIVFPALLSDNLFCGWGTQLLLIQAGYRVVSVLLMCIVQVYL